MWDHHTNTESRWQYNITSDKFIVQITGGSITILDRRTQTVLKKHKGYHCLYTGDINPGETQCFALENGKHFYVYSLENFELIKRVTLPRGYQCIDMYGHYTDDGTQICIPVLKFIEGKTILDGYYEHVLCHYSTQQFTLIEMVAIEDPSTYHWAFDEHLPTFDGSEVEMLQKIIDVETLEKTTDLLAAKLADTDFIDHLLGLKSLVDEPAIEEILKPVSDAFEDYFRCQGNKTEGNTRD